MSRKRLARRSVPAIYELIGEKLFDTDIKNSTFDTEDYDAGIGMTGRHKIRNVVESNERVTLLTQDLFRRPV